VPNYDFIAAQIAECDAQIKACMVTIADSQPRDGGQSVPGVDMPPTQTRRPKRPHTSKNEPEFDMHAELVRIAGVDLTTIGGIGIMAFQTIIAECGPNLNAKFPTENHFASWVGLTPNNRITGGKVKSRRTRRVVNRVANAFRICQEPEIAT
jgi:hypothetical protein